MQKLLFGLIGILLIPFVSGLATSLYQAMVILYMGQTGLQVFHRFLAGAGVWMFLFLFFPRPLRSYILAHELSHLFAAWITGVKGGALRIGPDGGSVEVERSTLWIALAPYIIPFYSLLLLAAHLIASLWWDPMIWSAALPFGLGLTWAFHLSFTLYILSMPQSDVQPYGRLGAYVLILSVNLLILCLALFTINKASFKEDLDLVEKELIQAYSYSILKIHEMIHIIKNAIIGS